MSNDNNLMSANNLMLFNKMLDKIIDEKYRRASLANDRQDSNAYTDVDRNYNAQKQYTAQRMGRIVNEQNKYPDSEQAQSDIFRNTFFNTPLQESMQLTEQDRNNIVYGTSKELVPQQRAPENVAAGGVFNKNMLKKLILKKLSEKNTSSGNNGYQANNMAVGGKQLKEKKKRRYNGNKWVDHVKSEAARFGLKYNDAMLDPRVKQSYMNKI